MSATPATVDMSAVRAQVAAGVASLDSAGNSSMCICEERYKGNMREERRKNGFWAAAISLTFGLFGMDCFYLGRTGEGIAKLFFGAFSAVILVGGAAAVIAIFNTRKVELFGPVSVGCTAVFALLFSIVGFFLWLVYAILIMSNKLYDGSGASLYWGSGDGGGYITCKCFAQHSIPPRSGASTASSSCCVMSCATRRTSGHNTHTPLNNE